MKCWPLQLITVQKDTLGRAPQQSCIAARSTTLAKHAGASQGLRSSVPEQPVEVAHCWFVAPVYGSSDFPLLASVFLRCCGPGAQRVHSRAPVGAPLCLKAFAGGHVHVISHVQTALTPPPCLPEAIPTGSTLLLPLPPGSAGGHALVVLDDVGPLRAFWDNASVLVRECLDGEDRGAAQEIRSFFGALTERAVCWTPALGSGTVSSLFLCDGAPEAAGMTGEGKVHGAKARGMLDSNSSCHASGKAVWCPQRCGMTGSNPRPLGTGTLLGGARDLSPGAG